MKTLSLLLPFSLFFACSSASTPPVTPKEHRPTAIQCDNFRTAGNTPQGGGNCASDADCTDGDNGRCSEGRGGSFCDYDSCFADSDCDKVCLCGEGFGVNRCLPAGNCKTDSDCGEQFCSPTLGSCGDYSGLEAFFCHTDEDECTDDSQCPGIGYCAFSAEVNHWVCSDAQCVG